MASPVGFEPTTKGLKSPALPLSYGPRPDRITWGSDIERADVEVGVVPLGASMNAMNAKIVGKIISEAKHDRGPKRSWQQ